MLQTFRLGFDLKASASAAIPSCWIPFCGIWTSSSVPIVCKIYPRQSKATVTMNINATYGGFISRHVYVYLLAGFIRQ